MSLLRGPYTKYSGNRKPKGENKTRPYLFRRVEDFDLGSHTRGYPYLCCSGTEAPGCQVVGVRLTATPLCEERRINVTYMSSTGDRPGSGRISSNQK